MLALGEKIDTCSRELWRTLHAHDVLKIALVNPTLSDIITIKEANFPNEKIIRLHEWNTFSKFGWRGKTHVL